ncbi:hypothetical protein Hanom_Chr15g01349601 [Helianthus anomalus]
MHSPPPPPPPPLITWHPTPPFSPWPLYTIYIYLSFPLLHSNSNLLSKIPFS